MQRDNQDFSDICRAKQGHVKLAGYVSCSYIARRTTLPTRAHPSVADVHHAQCTNISTHGNASFAGGGRALCGWKRLLCGWETCLLWMETPLRGRSGGHTGAAPTNLHRTPLPRNLHRFCPSAEPLPATFSCFSPSAEPLPATFSCFSPSAEPLPATFSCFSPSAEPLPAIISCFCPSAEVLPPTFAHETRKVMPFMKGLQLFFVILQPIVSITRKR